MNSRQEQSEKLPSLGTKRGGRRTLKVPEGSQVFIKTPKSSSTHGELYQFQVGRPADNTYDENGDPFVNPEVLETIIFVPDGVSKVSRLSKKEPKNRSSRTTRPQTTHDDNTERRGSKEHIKKTASIFRPYYDITRVRDGVTDMTPELDLRFALSAREGLNEKPTVEHVEEYWRRVAKFGSNWLEKKLTVPDLPLSQKELDEIRKRGQTVACMPLGLFQEGEMMPSILPIRVDLGVSVDELIHNGPVSGWFITQRDVNIAPPSVKVPDTLEDGKIGMNLPAYMMLLLDGFIQTRTISLDRNNSCLLPGTTIQGKSIEIGFESEETSPISPASSRRAKQLGVRWYRPLVREEHALFNYYNSFRD